LKCATKEGADMAEVGFGPKIDYGFCNGCRSCYNNCPSDVFSWDEEKGLPVIAYPNECYYCGTCELDCLEEAIMLKWPLHIMLYFGIYPNLQETSSKGGDKDAD